MLHILKFKESQDLEEKYMSAFHKSDSLLEAKKSMPSPKKSRTGLLPGS